MTFGKTISFLFSYLRLLADDGDDVHKMMKKKMTQTNFRRHCCYALQPPQPQLRPELEPITA
jgi:hypothetical protein